MKPRWSSVLLAAGVAALAGCGAVLSFKPGAGPDRMSADEHACGQAGDEGFVECMRNLGWYIKDTGSRETTGAPSSAAVSATAVPTAPIAAAVAAPVATAAPRPPTPTATTVATSAPSPSPSVTAPMATHATAIASATPVPRAPSAVAAPAGASDLPRVRVGSWWKFGGSATGLDSSIAACVQKLGAPHQPDPGAIVVTVALRDCLRSDGWYAYDVTPAP